MAYDPSQLSAATFCNGWTLWHYRTPDDWAEVSVPFRGYFNAAAGLLRRGDLITINANIDDDLCTFQAAVTHNSGGVVEVVRLHEPVRSSLPEPGR